MSLNDNQLSIGQRVRLLLNDPAVGLAGLCGRVAGLDKPGRGSFIKVVWDNGRAANYTTTSSQYFPSRRYLEPIKNDWEDCLDLE